MPKPNAEKADAENPLLSNSEIAAMRPAREVLGHAFIDQQRTPSSRSKALYRFEIYRDRAGAFRVRFRALNGEILFSSEAYETKQSAIQAIKTVQDMASISPIEDAVTGG